jgi:PhzF family phenazine biosynthesis protein
MALPLYVVDAFSSRPFAGNPAAVCLLPDGAIEEQAMQRIADEMNLSETAFVHPPEADPARPGEEERLLRWFTPAAEVELCGHATLASAHLLWELGLAEPSAPIAFRTRWSGTLTCRRVDGSPSERNEQGEAASGALIAMDFPADPPVAAEPPPGLIETLGVRPVAVARGRYDWIVEVATAEEVHAARPDFAALARFDARGVAVTALAETGAQHDIVSRFFAPRLRIAEDAVTGSIHCALGPYYHERLGERPIEALQASRRGGRLRVSVRGDRVELAGRAVTVLRGQLLG